MKEWSKAEITELELKCTEHGNQVTSYLDDVRTDDPVTNWFAFSSTTD